VFHLSSGEEKVWSSTFGHALFSDTNNALHTKWRAQKSLQIGGLENAYSSSGTLGRNATVVMKNLQVRIQSCCEIYSGTT